MSSCDGLAVRSVLVDIAASPLASALPGQDCCPDCLSYGLGLCQGSIAHIATRQLFADLHAHHHIKSPLQAAESRCMQRLVLILGRPLT